MAQACDQWLAGRRKVRAITLEGYTFALQHVVRRFGTMPLQQLSKQNLDSMVEQMLSKPLSVRTIRGTITTLRAVLEDARRQGLVSRNVAELVEMPRGTSRRMDTWTAQEAQQFAEHVAGERLHGCWRLTWGVCGAPRSSAWRGRPSTSTPEPSPWWRLVSASGAEPRPARPSQPRPSRPTVAAVHDGIAAGAEDQEKEEAMALGVAWRDDRLVAVREDGEPITPEHYSAEFRRLCVAAGVPRIRLHDARHTSVSLAISAGHDIAAVADWHGHSPGEMLKTYSHAQREALRAIGSLFG